MLAGLQPSAGAFDTDELHIGVIEEGGEHADRVAAAADAGDHVSPAGALPAEALLAGLVADDRWKSRTSHG